MLNHEELLNDLISDKPKLSAVPKKAKPHYTAAQVKQYQEEQRLMDMPVDDRIYASSVGPAM